MTREVSNKTTVDRVRKFVDDWMMVGRYDSRLAGKRLVDIDDENTILSIMMYAVRREQTHFSLYLHDNITSLYQKLVDGVNIMTSKEKSIITDEKTGKVIKKPMPVYCECCKWLGDVRDLTAEDDEESLRCPACNSIGWGWL